MAKVCSWCGRNIGFADMLGYDWVEINKKGYWICGKCCGDIDAAQKELVTFEEIATENTAPELLDYYIKKDNPEETEKKEQIRNEYEQRMEESRQNNPLYYDIHQIAGDLRFIKNCLIVSIICGIVLAVTYLMSVL